MLKLEAINAFYGDVQVLWDVSLEVPEGKVVALIGANAAGKTATLKAISGSNRIRSGRILFQGQPIHHLSPYQIVERGLVQVPEGRRLFTTLTVRENLELGAYSPGARAHLKESLEQVFDIFPELKAKAGHPAGSLSGGQQQMCAIARGLMARPRLLMIDEMSLGLAPLLVKKMFETVRRIAETGTTILLVEQNVHHTLALADWAYVLENGRVVLSGKAADLAKDEHLKRAYLGM